MSEKCPKCGSARKPKWTGFECGSEEHQFGMPYVQSLGCRITELERDNVILRKMLTHSFLPDIGGFRRWSTAEIEKALITERNK